MKHKIGFIGLGLIGGSIAKAIRQYYPDYEIVAFDKNKESLALATQESMIDVAATTIDNNFQNCNYIFLCAPVAYNTAYLKQLTEYLNDDCILTDVGSVKTNIHEEVQNLGIGKYFIGGHPMAGSEKSGYSNSKAMLIENAYYILTPTPQVAEEKVQTYEKFVESLKALPVILDYQLHDQITGTISHLPHIIASSLVNFVKTHDTHDEIMKNLAAGGFKDITRIASSSPIMWQNICLKNKDNIVDILDQYIDSLEDFKEAIEREDDLDLYNRFPEIIVIPCHLLRPDRSRKHLPYTVTSLMKPVGLLLSQPFLLPIISVSKTLESYTTENLKKGFCVLNSTTKIPANAP